MYMISVSGARGADVPHAWKKNFINQGGAGAEVSGLVRLWWGAELWIIVGAQGEMLEGDVSLYDDFVRCVVASRRVASAESSPVTHFTPPAPGRAAAAALRRWRSSSSARRSRSSSRCS